MQSTALYWSRTPYRGMAFVNPSFHHDVEYSSPVKGFEWDWGYPSECMGIALGWMEALQELDKIEGAEVR